VLDVVNVKVTVPREPVVPVLDATLGPVQDPL
jgi:hypothetical protein